MKTHSENVRKRAHRIFWKRFERLAREKDAFQDLLRRCGFKFEKGGLK